LKEGLIDPLEGVRAPCCPQQAAKPKKLDVQRAYRRAGRAGRHAAVQLPGQGAEPGL